MAIQMIAELKNLDNHEQVRAKFGELINLDGPAPASIVNRAFADEKFAFYLIMTKDSPQLKTQLLNDPRNVEFEDKEYSNTALLAKASGSLLRWAKAGFVKVDDATYEQRMSACSQCPHLKQPPQKAVYRALKLADGKQQSICGLCGCVAARKAKLPTESCPGQDPANPLLSRWGEPVKKPGTSNHKPVIATAKQEA